MTETFRAMVFRRISGEEYMGVYIILTLSLTPRFSGVNGALQLRNRFNGFMVNRANR